MPKQKGAKRTVFGNGAWRAVDIAPEAMFGLEDASGFGGLEEITDYDDKWLTDMRGGVLNVHPAPRVSASPATVVASGGLSASSAPIGTATAPLPVVDTVPTSNIALRKRKRPTADPGLDDNRQRSALDPAAKKLKKKEKKAKAIAAAIAVAEAPPAAAPKVKNGTVAPIMRVEPCDVSEWQSLGMPEPILRALSELGFCGPTKIQAACVPLVMAGTDVMGAAQTGSGKTLAFGLPILARLLEHKGKGLQALIVAPSRELAFQVRDHLVAAATHTGLRVVALVGGFAIPKQRRQLSQGPEIVVATPGRLWDLITLSDIKFETLKALKFLVIDEADRMVEDGRFKELHSVLNWMNQRADEDKISRQTMIFSATLTLMSQADKDKKERQLKRAKKDAKRGGESAGSADGTLGAIFDSVGLRPGHAVVDLSKSNGLALADNLVETRVTCPADDKDLFLWYFLLKYPGKAIVFVNSIDCLRRIAGVFSLIGLPITALHGQMPQRQRIKNLDRFRANAQGVLLASDVAARGIDVKIDHVIHYQFPRDVQTYIHRSGRTARASASGLSVALISPDDLASYKLVVHELNRGADLAVFPVEMSFFPDLRHRMSLALRIDAEHRKVTKVSKNNSWFAVNAEAMDLELDDDLLDHSIDADDTRASQAKLAKLRGELAALLSQPLYKQRSSRFVSASGGADSFAHDSGRLISAASSSAALDVARRKLQPHGGVVPPVVLAGSSDSAQ